MCLYPRLIKNRKYLPNKKNNGIPPEIKDPRTVYVPVGCGKCMECLKQKAYNWQVRLHEELRSGEIDEKGNSLNVLFIRLSFSDKWLIQLEQYINETKKKKIRKINKKFNKNLKYKPSEGYYLDNQIAKTAVRLFLERWRWEFKKSVKHWFVTELGQESTERIHLHGFLFTSKNLETIERIWKYGHVWIGEWVNEASVTYITKYIHKTDPKHKYYTPIILTSPGIGSNYLSRHNSKLNKFNDKETDETYITRTGYKLGLPIYYRNKIYTEDEREKLWINKLDEQTRYVNGIKVDVSETEDDYNRLLRYHRVLNSQLGYGDDSINYDDKKYENDLRNLKKYQRLMKTLNK